MVMNYGRTYGKGRARVKQVLTDYPKAVVLFWLIIVVIVCSVYCLYVAIFALFRIALLACYLCSVISDFLQGLNVCTPFPFDVLNRTWNSIESASDHCLIRSFF